MATSWRLVEGDAGFLVFDKEPGKTHKPLPRNHDCLKDGGEYPQSCEAISAYEAALKEDRVPDAEKAVVHSNAAQADSRVWDQNLETSWLSQWDGMRDPWLLKNLCSLKIQSCIPELKLQLCRC